MLSRGNADDNFTSNPRLGLAERMSVKHQLRIRKEVSWQEAVAGALVTSIAAGVGGWVAVNLRVGGVLFGLVAFIWLVVGGLVWLNRLLDCLFKEFPIITLIVIGVLFVPAAGCAIGWLLAHSGVEIRQEPQQFALLAQLIAILLVALTVEIAAPRLRGCDDRDQYRSAAAAMIIGLGLGGVVGLIASIWGGIHPSPGLAFLGTAAVAALLLAGTVAVVIPMLYLTSETPNTKTTANDSGRRS